MQKSLSNLHSLILFSTLFIFACESPAGEKSSDEYRKDSRLIEVNGTELYSYAIGEGDPLVVIHGGPGMSHGYFLPHLESLADKHQIIFYDHRASGQSSYDVDSSSMTMANFVEDLDGIRQHYGIEKMNIMGHSWGGLLAMWYAGTYPENLKSMILVNTIGASREFTSTAMANLNGRTTTRMRQIADSLTKTPGFMAQDSLALLEAFTFSFGITFHDPADLEKLNLSLASDRMERQAKLQFLFPDLLNYDLHEGLNRVEAPTLLIHGDYDANPLDAIKKIDEALPNSELFVIEDCGHWAFIEAPELFEEKVESFLGQLSQPEPSAD
jgi:proline iminopeptidase